MTVFSSRLVQEARNKAKDDYDEVVGRSFDENRADHHMAVAMYYLKLHALDGRPGSEDYLGSRPGIYLDYYRNYLKSCKDIRERTSSKLPEGE